MNRIPARKSESTVPDSDPCRVTICVLLFADYPELAHAAIDSIVACCPRAQYRLIVGCNACSQQTLEYVRSVPQIDRLIVSPENINKCPMQRQMFDEVTTEFVWWFDDDSHVLEPTALQRRLTIADAAPASTVLWGPVFFWNDQEGFNFGIDVRPWIRSQPWYSREPIPCDAEGKWTFVIGANWFARMSALRQLDWPPRSFLKAGDDALLAEAIRQSGWRFEQIGECGVAFQTHDRRAPETREMMAAQVHAP